MATRKRNTRRQTGRSVRRLDRKRKAMRPGKRVSRTGKVYTERRRNRSDRDRRKRL